jgi:hypothetical protein
LRNNLDKETFGIKNMLSSKQREKIGPTKRTFQAEGGAQAFQS